MITMPSETANRFQTALSRLWKKMPTSRKICANFVIRSGRLKQIAPDLFFRKTL
jgi:hypothetical protein